MGNKINWLNLVFVIDESGSMWSSKEDTLGGFKSVIEEQKKLNDGKVTISLYKFNDTVKCVYKGVDVNDIEELQYSPNGCTAMNDGIGTAITDIGKWLYSKDVNGEDMPSATLVVIMTDGLENASTEYKLSTVKDMIKEQTDKYSWQFMYIGNDLTTSKDADDLGIKLRAFTSKKSLGKGYDMINSVATNYRACFAMMDADAANANLAMNLESTANALTEEYEKEIGQKIGKKIDTTISDQSPDVILPSLQNA